MKDYEDEAFDDIERAQQRKVATGMTDGSGWRKRQIAEQGEPPPECQTEAEKTAFAFGWWKALESQKQEQGEPVALQLATLMDENQRLRAELKFNTTPQQLKPLSEAAIEGLAKFVAVDDFNYDFARAIEKAHGIGVNK